MKADLALSTACGVLAVGSVEFCKGVGAIEIIKIFTDACDIEMVT